MVTNARFRGAPLAARLVALVIVPLVALGVMAFQRIDRERLAAEQASTLVAEAELQEAVAAVYPPAQLEGIALEGLARIDELGVPRALIVSAAGVDLESIYAANEQAFDRALDDLTERYRSTELTDGTLLGDRLGRVRGAIETQRELSTALRAQPDDVSAVFDELYQLLEDTLESADPIAEGSASYGRSRTRLDNLAAVLVSAGEHGSIILGGIVYRTDELAAQMARTIATHEAYLDRFETLLDDDERDAFADVRALLDPTLGGLSEVPDALGDGPSLDPMYIRQSATALLGHLEYVGALQEFSERFHDDVSDRVQAAADTAHRDVGRTQLLLWAIGLLTAASIGFVLWSILIPIRRLRRRAAAIGNGELALEPLPLRGPSDVRALTGTMNDMLSTLHRVDDEIARLAAGDVDAESLPDLPGAIGVSMRESVARLTTVTAQLHRSQALSSAIVDQAADAIWTIDESGRIRTANEASRTLTRVPIDEQIGRPLSDFLTQTTGEATVLAEGGSEPRVLVAHSVVDMGDERVTAVIAHDISERSRFEERLTYQAHHDALTGLPNRFAVLQHLDGLIAGQAEEVAVLFVDLDAFKSVNDTQGHAVGDRVLADVAATISRTVRNGEFVGRLGGDEFVIVARNFAQPADVIALGHRIIREVEQPHEHSGQVFVLSASVGVAIPPVGTSALDTIRQADNAVYQAKRRGRGRVELFDASMQERIEREAELELALRHAVRNGELVVHLQPVVDLHTGIIGGAEALVRWERPGHGLVPPGDFIPVAERSSLIFEVERWVLTSVCERLAEWRDHDPDSRLRIAVNISGRHLIEGDLVSDVDAALSLTGADPAMLELELTESQLLEDLEHATTVLESIRARGISIAVDDFGTGYSSMTYLRHLPIDAVKIDRSFVARATEHGYDSTVIEALLTIGRTLDLAVVAEGVETDDQLEFVRARGCDRAQGFLLARPMPIAEAEAIIFGGDRAAAAPVAVDVDA